MQLRIQAMRRPGLEPGSGHVGFVVDEVALGQVFSPAKHSTDCSTLITIHGWYNRPVVASVILGQALLNSTEKGGGEGTGQRRTFRFCKRRDFDPRCAICQTAGAFVLRSSARRGVARRASSNLPIPSSLAFPGRRHR
jgi:hypothetical protein